MAKLAHGELWPVFGTCLAHQSAYVGFNCALLDAGLAGNLPIRTGLQDQAEYFMFTVRQMGVGVGKAGVCPFQQPVNQFERRQRGAQMDPDLTA
jgi:hypothetical protein